MARPQEHKMRIGLVSDTHIPKVARALPAELIAAFRGVDLILHAGDIYDLSVLDDLESIAPVLAARGDDDDAESLADRRVKGKHILKLEGQTLWLVHERPYAPVSQKWLPTWWESRIDAEQNKYGKPDIVVFGHEHRTIMQRVHGALFINSGSPTFLNYNQGLGTVGILEIEPGAAEARIIHL